MFIFSIPDCMNCPSRPARGNISASNQQEEEQKPKLVRQELILAIWYYVKFDSLV